MAVSVEHVGDYSHYSNGEHTASVSSDARGGWLFAFDGKVRASFTHRGDAELRALLEFQILHESTTIEEA
jgi:hypothetical protein